MNKVKKTLAAALALTLSASLLAGCGGGKDSGKGGAANAGAAVSSVEAIKEKGKVIIGVFSDKAPFGYIDANGKYQGYDIYFGDRIGQELGVDVEYVSVEPASRVEFLKTGKVDIILANFTVTPSRQEEVDFALPYMKVKLGVVSPDSNVITDVSQLEGKKLIVAKGTTADMYFTENHPEIELVKFDQYSQAYSAFLAGRGDAFSTDNTEVLAWAKVNEGYTVGIRAMGNADTIAPAVQKGDTELRAWIDALITKLADEDFFHKNFEATLKPVYGDEVDADELVVEGGQVD